MIRYSDDRLFDAIVTNQILQPALGLVEVKQVPERFGAFEMKLRVVHVDILSDLERDEQVQDLCLSLDVLKSKR